MKDRISQVFKHLNLSQAEFERLSGLGNGALTGLIKSDKNVYSNTLTKVSNAFPDLNMNWLLTGSGDMMLSGELVRDSKTPTKSTNNLQLHEKKENNMDEMLKMLKEQNDYLKSQVEFLQEQIRSKDDQIIKILAELKTKPREQSDASGLGKQTR